MGPGCLVDRGPGLRESRTTREDWRGEREGIILPWQFHPCRLIQNRRENSSKRLRGLELSSLARRDAAPTGRTLRARERTMHCYCWCGIISHGMHCSPAWMAMFVTLSTAMTSQQRRQQQKNNNSKHRNQNIHDTKPSSKHFCRPVQDKEVVLAAGPGHLSGASEVAGLALACRKRLSRRSVPSCRSYIWAVMSRYAALA